MIKQNPFSVYDFMGYFIPGALLIYLSLYINQIEDLNYQLTSNNLFNIEGEFQFQDILFFVIISYSLGHLINFISSMTIEKFAIWKYDYPSKFLLGFDKKPYWKKNSFSGYLSRIILPILILPVAFFDLIFGEFLNLKDLYTRKLDDMLVELIKHKGLNLVISLFGDNNTSHELRHFDFFRVFAHYGFENSKSHQEKLNNYIALYGFLRTMTFISVLCFWFSIYGFYCNTSQYINFYTIVVCGFISYLFFMAFMKFYRRYTLEGLMIIAIDKEIK